MSTSSMLPIVVRILGLLLLVLALLLLLGCGSKPEQVTSEHMERAQTALVPLKQQLIGELSNAMADGPVHAIEVCQVRAPEIAASLSSADVAMGRTSHRLRNPENAPQPWMEPLLTSYLANPSSTDPKAVLLGEVTVAPGERRIIMHFASQNINQAIAYLLAR